MIAFFGHGFSSPIPSNPSKAPLLQPPIGTAIPRPLAVPCPAGLPQSSPRWWNAGRASARGKSHGVPGAPGQGTTNSPWGKKMEWWVQGKELRKIRNTLKTMQADVNLNLCLSVSYSGGSKVGSGLARMELAEWSVLVGGFPKKDCAVGTHDS